MTRRILLFLIGWAGMIAAIPAAAQVPSPQLRERAEQVAALLRGEVQPAEIFTSAFLAAVPEAQIGAVIEQLRAEHGAVGGLDRIEPRSATSGTIHIATERAVLRMNLDVEDEPPHLISGLVVTGAEVRGDTPAAVIEALRALPGEVSFAIARLGGGAPELVAGHQSDRPLAIGSTFKLWILAELSRQARAGGRRWSDVVTLDRRSLPSGLMQNWPPEAPATVHTLASLMISISDNTATDMLLHTLGRENVERMMTTIGVAAAARNRPFLSTLELFALKTATDDDLHAWSAADEAQRRRLLADRYVAIDPAGIDPARFAGPPLRIGQLEWFASAEDLVRTMDWLRRHGDDDARAILAISPGGPPTLREDFAYVGFKGGSEPGVINLTWLVRSRAGAWHAVTGSWNNPQAPVDEARFVALMSRALQLVR